jgi:superfamily I DNA/RNA helicase
MTANLLDNQANKRQAYLEAILASDSPRKLVVAGPGTGKTYTFGKLFKKSGDGDHLALTFIRRLVADMDADLGQVAEVKTFHAFCKKLLHRAYGGFVLSPFLTQVIAEDSKYLDLRHSHFDIAFQTLDEGSGEIAFYLERGDYYDAVSFNDSVYRVLLAVRKNAGFLPKYSQIVIDEFQDFNPLEVAFIDELQKKGPILIVGDDPHQYTCERSLRLANTRHSSSHFAVDALGLLLMPPLHLLNQLWPRADLRPG